MAFGIVVFYIDDETIKERTCKYDVCKQSVLRK